MKDMELDDESKSDLAIAAYPTEVGTKRHEPEHPYGLQICLNNAELEKLGLKMEDCCVGGTVHGHFMAAITSVSSNEDGGGMRNRVELQIKQLALESEDAENEESEAAKPRARLKAVYKS